MQTLRAREHWQRNPTVPKSTAQAFQERACTCAGTLFFTRVGFGMWMAVAREGSDVLSGVSKSPIFLEAPSSARPLGRRWPRGLSTKEKGRGRAVRGPWNGLGLGAGP